MRSERPEKIAAAVAASLLLGVLGAGAREPALESKPRVTRSAGPATRPEELRMWMTVGERRFAITLADNPAGRAFAAQLPLSLNMSELNGNEKHAELLAALPANASRPGTLRNGDLMLWGDKTLVVFYLTFSSPYAYTRLGSVDDPTGLPQALGPGEIKVVFSSR